MEETDGRSIIKTLYNKNRYVANRYFEDENKEEGM